MPDHAPVPDTAAAGLLIADSLNEASFGVRDLTEEHARVIQVTDARAAFCQLTITDTGHLTWEYIPLTGRHTDPARLAAITAVLLAAPPAPAPAPAWALAGPTLRGTAGRMLRALGLHVTLAPAARNEESCEASTDLHVTSPGRPGQGRVTLTDEGMIIWECLLADPSGLTPSDTAATIGRALSTVQHPGHPEPAACCLATA